jgi:peptidoglycan/xylan/chitin deacetylase (PgdA/CDA1 family)
MKTLRSSLSSAFFHGAKLLGTKQEGMRILCYHRVNDLDQNYMTVPVISFRAQMEFLFRQGYRTAKLSSLLVKETDERNLVITFDDGYRDNYENAYPILKELGYTATIFCIADRVNTEGYLTIEDIRQMERNGFEFGSHTVSHPHLARLDSEEKWLEISNSKKQLEALIHKPVNFFCYPYGEYDGESVGLVKKAGYLGACSNHPGGNRTKINPYLLKRTEISPNDSLYDFEKKISGAFDLIHQGLHWVRGRA